MHQKKCKYKKKELDKKFDEMETRIKPEYFYKELYNRIFSEEQEYKISVDNMTANSVSYTILSEVGEKDEFGNVIFNYIKCTFENGLLTKYTETNTEKAEFAPKTTSKEYTFEYKSEDIIIEDIDSYTTKNY